MPSITVVVDDELFRFTSFAHWVNHGKEMFERSGYRGSECLCVDAKGRICTCGREFRIAKEDDSYPIIVYPQLVLP